MSIISSQFNTPLFEEEDKWMQDEKGGTGGGGGLN
jgi:hypothetical protein